MRQKNQQKHSEKKVSTGNFGDEKSSPIATETDLFSATGTKPIDQMFATAEQLFPFTGFDEAKLRRLGISELRPDKSPYVPKPIRGKFPVAATLRGCREYREHQLAQAGEHRLDKVSFETMELCAGATGIPKTIQQLAKNKGCAAFRGPRVYLLDLIKWIFTAAASGDAVNWNDLDKKISVQLKQVELDEKYRRLIPVDEARAICRDLNAIWSGAAQRALHEYPRDFEMRTKEHIKEEMTKKNRQLIAATDAELEKLENESPTAGDHADNQPELKTQAA